jgi:GTP-binding protein
VNRRIIAATANTRQTVRGPRYVIVGHGGVNTDRSAPDMQQASPNPLRGAAFVLAAHRPNQLPADSGAEVAFAGRSNAGKSSAINALAGQAKLARTSATPGRTQQLAVFALPDGRRLIDLPGYGYAKVPAALRDHWRQAIDTYLRTRACLRGLVLISDIRHAPAEFDRQMLAFCAGRRLPCVVLLSKADKLSRAQSQTRQREVDRTIMEHAWRAQTIAFSATSGAGVAEARAEVAALLD